MRLTWSRPLRRIAGMTSAFAVSNVVRAAIGLATAGVIARGLGTSEFGRFTFCVVWAATLTMLVDLGFGVMLTRDAARGDSALGRAVTGAMLARVLALAPLAVVLIVAGPWSGAGTRWELQLVGWLAAVSAVYGCLSAALRAWPEWLPVVLAIEAIGAALQLAASAWAIGTGGRTITLLAIAAAVQLAQLVAALFVWKASAARHERLAWPRLASIHRLVGGALPFAASGIVANAQLRLPSLMLGYVSPAAELGLYGAASKIGQAARMLPQAMFGGALPVIADEAAHHPDSDVRSGLASAVTLYAALAAAGVIVLARPLIAMAFGDEFAGAVSPLVWLGAGILPGLVNSNRKVCFLATGQERDALRWSVVALVIQAALCATLIPRFGASGAAAAIAAGELAIWWPLRRCERAVEREQLVRGPHGIVSDRPLARG